MRTCLRKDCALDAQPGSNYCKVHDPARPNRGVASRKGMAMKKIMKQATKKVAKKAAKKAAKKS